MKYPIEQLKKMNQRFNPISAPSVTYKGFDRLPEDARGVFVSNHLSTEDIAYILDVLPAHVHLFLPEYDISKNRTRLKKRTYTSYKEWNGDLAEEMEKTLAETGAIFFFPETHPSPNGILMPIPSDVGTFFQQTKAPVYPVHIGGAEHIKTCRFQEDALSYYENITVTVGKSFYPVSSDDEQASSMAAAHALYTEMNHQSYLSKAKESVNLYNELIDRVRVTSDVPSIRDEHTALSYRRFLISASVLGTKFEKLFEQESRIGTFLPTSVVHALTFFGLLKSGKSPVMLNFSMGIQNLLNCCETAGIRTVLTAKAFIRQANLENAIEHLAEKVQILYLEDIQAQLTSSDKLVGLADAKMGKKIKTGNDEIIFFTSGSENVPKGVVLTHDNMYANMQQTLSCIHVSPKERFMNVLPMFHSFGMTIGCVLPILYGLEVFLHPSPISYKRIPKLIFEHQSTVLFGTSTFLLNYGKTAEKHHLQTLRYTVAGAEKLKDEIIDMWHSKFGIRIIEGYGVTETAPVLALNRPYNYETESVGQLLPGMDWRIEAVEGIPNGGNLLVKGPNLMRGYLLHEKGFVPHEGWYRTGDVVETNETGHLFIKARLKRFAKLGGEMVSLNLVEQIASDCFGHANFAAVSIPDKRKGERVVLFTTVEDIKERVLKKYIKEQKLSNLLLPYKVEYIEQIPLLGTGKTDYLRLQKIAEEQFLKNR